MKPPSPVLITHEIAAFVTGAVSISIGSRNATMKPSLTRGLACAVSNSRLRVLVNAEQSRAVLEDIIASGGRIAAVFSRPSSHRTIRFKAVDAVIEPLGPDDMLRAAAYREALVGELVGLGFSDSLVRNLTASAENDLVVIGFTPDAAFDQSPGPRAGRPLDAGNTDAAP